MPERFSSLRHLVHALLLLSGSVAPVTLAAATAATATSHDNCPLVLTGKPAGRPVIGLVLSGGGARGAAHLGVLRVIEELGIPVDLVVGTSMGSVVGALYASGTPVADIDRIVRETNWPDVLSDGPPYEYLSLSRKHEKHYFQLGGRLGVGSEGVRLPSGLREGQNVRLMLRGLTRHVADIDCFHNLAIPFAAVATDASSGEAVVLDHGDLVMALRASMAIPAYLSPVELDNRLLVDGGPANNMPVSVARAMGADVVIAIDIATPFTDREKLRSLFSISMQMTTMLARRAADEERLRLKKEDVLIVPALAGIETLDFDRMPAAITAGEQAARVALADWQWRQHATNADRPATRFADRYAAARAPARLGEIFTHGDAVLPSRQIIDRFGLKPGSALEDAKLNRAITRVYGLDYFSTVDYRRLPGTAGDDIVLDIKRREWGPTYLQFGLGFYDNFEGINRFTLGASLTATHVNRLTGQFNAQVTLGSTQRVFAEFYQPVTVGAALFIAPWALYDRHNLDIYAAGSPVARLRTGSEEAGLDLGWAGRHGELRLGYGGGTRRLDVLIGPPTVPAFSTETGYLRISGEIDRQDDRDFPTRGARIQTLAEHGRPGFGSAGVFDHATASASVATTWGNQHFLSGFTAEMLDIDGTLRLEPPNIGGPLNLSAFNPGELLGDNTASVRLMTYRRMNQLSFLKLYLGGALEFGGAWNGSPNDVDEKKLWPVASVFAGLSSPIGPIFLVGGLSENGHRAVHFQLGYRF